MSLEIALTNIFSAGILEEKNKTRSSLRRSGTPGFRPVAEERDGLVSLVLDERGRKQ